MSIRHIGNLWSCGISPSISAWLSCLPQFSNARLLGINSHYPKLEDEDLSFYFLSPVLILVF